MRANWNPWILSFEKESTRLHKTKVKRHSKLFDNHLTSRETCLCPLLFLFCQVICDFRVSAVASRTASFSLYLSLWISVCVIPRLSSWSVDSWATWGKVFSSFSQVSSSRLGTTNHTLYREPVLLFPDMLTTPPWTYIQPACRRKCNIKLINQTSSYSQILVLLPSGLTWDLCLWFLVVKNSTISRLNRFKRVNYQLSW